MGKTKVENKNSGLKFLKQYIIPVILVIVVFIILSAMICGGSKNGDVADWDAYGEAKNGVSANRSGFDLEVININKKDCRKFNITPKTGGVIITEIEGNSDVRMRLRKGDVIREINGKRINSVRDFRKVKRIWDPAAGLFLDIDRSGYPMYVSIPGPDGAFNRQSAQSQTTFPFQTPQVAPVLGNNIHVGGINTRSGVLHKELESWIDQNFGSGYYACPDCGTLVPSKDVARNSKSVLCPNCRKKMILK